MRPARSARPIGALLVVLMLVSSCGEAVSDKYAIEDDPVTLEEVPGSELLKVTLTSQATERLGIETEQVSSSGDILLVPSGALWLDTAGIFWVYMNPQPNVYVRHAVTVTDDDGRFAELSAGPEAGTRVVSVGVPELFGAEVGVGK